jgi:hypothetical protein
VDVDLVMLPLTGFRGRSSHSARCSSVMEPRQPLSAKDITVFA